MILRGASIYEQQRFSVALGDPDVDVAESPRSALERLNRLIEDAFPLEVPRNPGGSALDKEAGDLASPRREYARHNHWWRKSKLFRAAMPEGDK
jgi:hypothetical protein